MVNKWIGVLVGAIWTGCLLCVAWLGLLLLIKAIA